MTKNKFWKYKDMKTYASTEWLAHNSKRYRSVFDEQEAAYVYCELSFYNKKYDEANWNISLNRLRLLGILSIIVEKFLVQKICKFNLLKKPLILQSFTIVIM